MAAREPAGPSTPTTTVFCCGVFVMSPLTSGYALSNRVGPSAQMVARAWQVLTPPTARHTEGQTRRPKARPRFAVGSAGQKDSRDSVVAAACPARVLPDRRRGARCADRPGRGDLVAVRATVGQPRRFRWAARRPGRPVYG